jgi:predicted TIM-barrel fold metal-dependent hydrolase/quinol monooxygenase YgiN
MKHLLLLILSLLAVAARGQGVIDLHSHIIPQEMLSALQREDRLMDEGFPLPRYDADSHLRWMDEAGVQTAVITLAAPQPASAAVVRQTNETAARIKKEHSGRFLFCAALPLPDVGAAIREAVYALDSLGADGIKLATNACGQYLGAPELDTLFSMLNERGALVILHPHRPEPVNSQVMQQTPLAMQEYLSETTRAVANMISRNVLARYPRVRVVVPHCGAYLPLAVPRMKSLAPVMQANKMVGAIDWHANLSSLYFDLAGSHSPEVIRTLLTITTPDHLLYGSDYPYVAPQALTAGLQRMQRYLTDEPDLAPFREMILHGNAERLLNLPAQTSNPNAAGIASSSSAVMPGSPQGKDNTQPLQATVPTSKSRESEAANPKHLIVRIAEIEVYPQYLQEYLVYANEVDRLSVEREPGVVCLFPMQTATDSCQIRILEIYASDEAYQSHLKTDHFQRYKQGTAHMVKSLSLPAMQPLDPAMMPHIFRKQPLSD